MATKNHIALIEYFRAMGLDANLIPENSVDSTGFDYIRVNKDGNPIYSGAFELTYDRKTWRNPQDFKNVLTLLDGGTKVDIEEWPEISNATDLPSGVYPEETISVEPTEITTELEKTGIDPVVVLDAAKTVDKMNPVRKAPVRRATKPKGAK